MKIDERTRNLLLGILGVAIAVAAYVIVASPMKEKTAALAAENATLKEKKDEYEAIHAQIDTYVQGINDLTAEREELLSAFPAGITKEDEIIYWANMERQNADTLAITDLTMAGWQEVFAEGYEAPQGENEEGATQLHLYKAPVNYGFQATYDGIKGMVSYVYAQQDKKSIENLAVAFDETTGNLVGTLDMNMYYMVGTGKEYTPMTIPSIPTGISNLFHSSNTKVVMEGDGVSGYDASEGEAEGEGEAE